ncbi:hypothetical protein JVX90_00035 [Gordonia sp. PDNC005]|uniref:hypothetical protein n=1 Tax=Gordonia sp. PDNC005 TaxID=2811424 RepID=UPI00196640FA|nr:hypothetical protein [Gordonia sp. PDNC005]QRY62701.1 hypothetical protein JVX90_00035 [Gordonia sp. PDNC005]
MRSLDEYGADGEVLDYDLGERVAARRAQMDVPPPTPEQVEELVALLRGKR